MTPARLLLFVLFAGGPAEDVPAATEKKEREVRRRIEAAEVRFRRQIAKQQKMVGPVLCAGCVGPPTDVRGHEATQFASFVRSTEEELLSSLRGGELEGLRAYVRVSIPDDGSIQRVATVNGREVVPETVAEKVLARIAAVFQRLQSFDRLSLRIVWSAKPTGARVEVTPIGGGMPRTLFTDGEMTIYRGIYKYAVSAPGSLSLDESLDLINEAPTRIECDLSPAAATANAGRCNLR